MVKKIEIDSLRSRLDAVRRLESRAREVGDPVGALQFKQQISDLQALLDKVEQREEPSASWAIYFGGDPVVGSRGIEADFAGKVMDDVQNLVSNEFASEEAGGIGTRGPVRERNNSGLMITEIARGSFGFVFEEAERNQDMFASPLAPTLEKTLAILDGFASPDPGMFEEVVSDLEPRVLTAAKKLFQTIDNARASMRIVSGTEDHSFTLADIRRSRQRAEQILIDEHVVEFEGTLIGLLPVHRRFEFNVSGTGEVLSGKVASDVAKILGDGLQNNLLNPIGRRWVAEFRLREVTSRNAEPKLFYTLTRLLRELPAH